MMKQQIGFFESLTRLRMVEYVPIILFLNQTDVLERMITTRPISNYFEDYTGGANCFQACRFFAKKFATSDQRVVGNLRIYGTCAVDESSFRGPLKCLLSQGGNPSISISVTKLRVDEEIRMDNEEIFSQRLFGLVPI